MHHLTKNLTNKKFGRLTALKLVGRDKSGKLLWECLCSCGNKTVVISSKLISGWTKSCGCFRKEKSSGLLKVKHLKPQILTRGSNWRGYGEIGLTYFNSIKYGAKSRNLEFKLTIEDLWNLFLKQGKKCALSGLELTMFRCIKNQNQGNASLDRINSLKGYTIDNVQWIHKDINQMKMGIAQDERQRRAAVHSCQRARRIHHRTLLGLYKRAGGMQRIPGRTSALENLEGREL